MDHSGARFRVLGPLEVWDGPHRLAIAGGQQRTLLAALLLNANRVVSTELLVACLWGQSPPRNARRLLHGCVAALRRMLRVDQGGADRQPIVTYPSGYLMEVRDGELDLDRFTELVESARQCVQGGPARWEAASDLLAEALSLWRGMALHGVMLHSLTAEVAALEERRLVAVEERIDVDLRLGRHSRLVHELQALVAANPLRERLWAQLLVALAATERQADALAVYQQARARLVDELGVEPGWLLRRLHELVLSGNDLAGVYPEVRASAPAAEPEPPESTAGPAPNPPTVNSCRRRPPAQLPLDVKGFTGREAELRALDGLLQSARAESSRPLVAVISGPAGMGKTALAIHWAHRVRAQFPDGQLYIDLRGASSAGPALDPGQALRDVFASVGVSDDRLPPGRDSQVGMYRTEMLGRRALIVLDNARDASQVRPLLAGGTGCVVLVTSRDPIADLVAVEGAHPLMLDRLDDGEARRFLANRLGGERVAAEPDAAEQIIRRCSGLPMALTVAAANAAIHPDLPLASAVDAVQRPPVANLPRLAAGMLLSTRRASHSTARFPSGPPV